MEKCNKTTGGAYIYVYIYNMCILVVSLAANAITLIYNVSDSYCRKLIWVLQGNLPICRFPDATNTPSSTWPIYTCNLKDAKPLVIVSRLVHDPPTYHGTSQKSPPCLKQSSSQRVAAEKPCWVRRILAVDMPDTPWQYTMGTLHAYPPDPQMTHMSWFLAILAIKDGILPHPRNGGTCQINAKQTAIIKGC